MARYANEAIAKFAAAYTSNITVRNDVDSWIKEDNKITANMGYAVKLKVANPSLEFRDD